MSTAGLPTFKKLWGKIKHDLPKGEYLISIENNYNVHKFSGRKSLIITTTSNLGGKMNFLGIIALVIGSVSVIGGCVIFAMVYYFKRKGINF